MVTFDQFYAAIKSQESSGNYGAVNSRTGALGAYQILPGNIIPWSRQYLGRTITPTQFRNSPQLQDSLARAVLHSYYDKYGARGAASTWYSGNPRGANNYTRFRSNEPSIGEYVDGVISKARRQPGGIAEAPFEAATNTQHPTAVKAEAEDDDDDMLSYSGLSGYGLGLGGTDEPLEDEDNTATGSAAGEGALGLTTPVGAVLEGEGVPQEPEDLRDNQAPDMGAPTHHASATRQAVIDFAKQLLGTPYVWGGETSNGVDCSGLVQLAMKRAGISVPRVSYQQVNMGTRTPISKLQPGDLIGWDYSSRNDGADHIAIYLGNNKIIEAPAPGMHVRIHDLYDLNHGAAKPFGVSISNIYGGN